MKGDKDIKVEFIDSIEQRYNTCVDYFETDTEVIFRISKQNDPRKNLLIMFHEMVEYALCTDRGITEEAITEFDLLWEKENPTGIADGLEPGYASGCPYAKEHLEAELIERRMAALLGIDWKEYEENLISK